MTAARKSKASRAAGVRRRERNGRAVYEARWRDPDGKLRGKTFPREADANAFLVELRQSLRAGDYVDPQHGKQKWSAVADAWLDAKKRRGLKVSTTDGYRRILDGWLAAWKDRQIASLTHADVEAVLHDLDTAGRQTQTVHNVFNVAQSVFDYAQKRRMIAANPCRLVREDLPSRAQVDRTPQFLAASQVQALADELPPPYGLMVTFAAWSGLRAGEIAGLRVRHLDLLHNQVHVQETLVIAKGGLRRDTPKSRASHRLVPLPPTLTRLLGEHIAANGLGPDDYVFGRDGKPLRHNNFYRREYKPAAKRIGIPSLTFHALRHTYASLMAQQGYSAVDVSRRMGHGSISVTLDVYTHLWPDTSDAARLDAAFVARDDAPPSINTKVAT